MNPEEEPRLTGKDSPPPALSLVITCFNEEDVLRTNVERVLEVFQRKNTSIELIVVDNGSSDRTGTIIDELISRGLPVVKEVVRVNQGYGNGVLHGLRRCRGKLAGIVPADLQVEADSIFKVYEIAANVSTPHLVKVRRRFRMDGLKRKVVSIIFNYVTNVLFGGLGSIDINGNPKILPRDYVNRMQLESRDWFIDTEILVKAKRLGLPIIEFNVLGQMREGGQSNVHASSCWQFIVNLLRWRFGASGRVHVPEKIVTSQHV